MLMVMEMRIIRWATLAIILHGNAGEYWVAPFLLHVLAS
jgi:hypothetical protein